MTKVKTQLKKPKEFLGMELKVWIILLILLFSPLIAMIVSGTPLIISHNNSISGNGSYPHADISDTIIFNATANEVPITWHWFTDGIDQLNNAASLTESWTTAGAKNVTVYVTTATGNSPNISWYPIIERTMASAANIRPTNIATSYTNLTNSLNDFDIGKFFSTMSEPFTEKVGNLFYVFLYVIPIIIIWIRQEKALIPAGLGIILGAVYIPYLPESFVIPAIMFIVITFVGVIYSLFKER